MSFDLFYGETIGASHIKKNTPKEDSGLTYETDKYKIFAVADGHGDPNCCRSELGSRFCCESAKEKLVPFMENINADDLFKTGIQFNIVNHLFSSILYSWTTKVNEHYENNPFTEDELNSLDPSFKSMYLKGNRIEHIYGTTLIVGILTDKFLLLIQQGDSHCFMINAKGEFFVPIPGDANCIGNVTTSMCDKDAHEAFRYTVVELDKFDLAACFLATDGFEDCYGAHFNRTAAGVAELINVANERGIIGLESYLDKRLPEMTATGSADDITVTGVIDLEKTRPLTNVFENMVRSIDLNFEIRAKEKKIADRVNKMNFLTNRYNNTKTEYDRVVKTLEKHKILLEKYKQDKENLKERIFVKEE